MSIQIPKSVQPLVDFMIQVVFGAIAFVIILCVACCLAAFMNLIEPLAPHWVIKFGEYAEKALFGLDITCFGLFLLSEIIKYCKAFFKEMLEVLRS